MAFKSPAQRAYVMSQYRAMGQIKPGVASARAALAWAKKPAAQKAKIIKARKKQKQQRLKLPKVHVPKARK